MRFGVNMPGTVESARRAQRAEAVGFSSVRFWDSPLVAGDVFVSAAAAAVTTSRIRIGTSVYVPWTRDPAVTACAFASLNALAPGRIELTAGTGRTARRSYGLRPQPLAAFRAHIEAVMTMLSGGDADIVVEGTTASVRLLHPGITTNISDPVTLTIAAAGPKIQTLTADLGAGWADILPPSAAGEPESLRAMKSAWQAAGRDLDTLRATYFVALGGILRKGETAESDRIRATAGPLAMSEVHYWADEVHVQGKTLPPGVPDAVRAAVEGYLPILDQLRSSPNQVLALQEGHCMFVRPDEEHLLTPELLRSSSCIWSQEEFDSLMSELEQAGVHEVVLSVRPRNDDDIDDIARALRLIS